MTIGACATAGGIQAMRNWANHDAFRAAVYAHPEYIESLATAQPVADYVKVDAELRGCPIDAGQLLEFVTSLLTGRRPNLPDEAVCAACKRAGRVCVMVAKGIPCLGPVTMTGCGALCPGFDRGCYGCFGPREQANASSLGRQFVEMGRTPAEAGRLFAGFTGYAEPFRELLTELGGVPGTTAAGPGRSGGSRPRGDGCQPASGREVMTTETPAFERSFRVEGITRVEGEGTLHLVVRDGEVTEARLRIFEAPRYFEQLVVGRHPDQVLDIVARICGICPEAYQMSAAGAFESIFGVTIDPQVRALRRLLYAGEYIESHALHVYLLHAPDFLGYAERDRPGEGPPRGGRAGPRAQEGRQRADGGGRRPLDPPGERPDRRAVSGADPR